jgi:hypothetical protein
VPERSPDTVLEALRAIARDAPMSAGTRSGLQRIADEIEEHLKQPSGSKLVTWTSVSAERLARELLAQCDAYHTALDALFAMMILETRRNPGVHFFPSKSGQPWEAMQAGRALAERARDQLKVTTNGKSKNAHD